MNLCLCVSVRADVWMHDLCEVTAWRGWGEVTGSMRCLSECTKCGGGLRVSMSSPCLHAGLGSQCEREGVVESTHTHTFVEMHLPTSQAKVHKLHTVSGPPYHVL